MSKKYLNIIGVIEIICTVIGGIYAFILVMGLSFDAKWAYEAAGILGTAPLGIGTKFILWLVLIVGLFISPAIGVLFLTVAGIIEKMEKVEVGNLIVKENLKIIKKDLNQKQDKSSQTDNLKE